MYMYMYMYTYTYTKVYTYNIFPSKSHQVDAERPLIPVH